MFATICLGKKVLFYKHSSLFLIRFSKRMFGLIFLLDFLYLTIYIWYTESGNSDQWKM